nr:MAG TPA: TmCorA-like maritima CorA-like family [Caudoviricetes sp.]
MRNVLIIIGILFLIATLWTAFLGFPKVSGFLGICWSIVMLAYVIAGAFY